MSAESFGMQLGELRAPLRGAAESYRRDLAARADRPFGGHDGDWILTASLLGRACVADASAATVALFDQATALAGRLLEDTPADTRAGGAAPARPVDSVLTLARQMELAGALHLTLTVVESLPCARVDVTPLEAGRALAVRARLTWKLGDMELAHDLYSRLAAAGRSLGEPELLARAWLGYAALAQIRGDTDALRHWSRRVLSIPALDESSLRRPAVQGLMMAAAASRNFEEAILRGWELYRLSVDDDGNDEVLTNLGQLLLDVDRAVASRAAFAAVLTRTQPSRIAFPALGGFCEASARLGDTAAVYWSADEMKRLADSANEPVPITRGLLECAKALVLIGDDVRARECQDAAAAVAARAGHAGLITRTHELSPLAPPDERRVPTTPRKRFARVVDAIEALNPAALPKRIRLAAVA